MTAHLDQTQDFSGAVQHKLITAYNAPDFVKSASFDELNGDVETLPEIAYAGTKSFPRHTKAATWLSAAFFAYNRDQLPEKTAAAIEEKLMVAANAFKITDLVQNLITKIAADINEDTDPVADYALVYSDKGQIKQAFPMRNTAEVLAASQVFKEHRHKLAFPVRCDMARRILDKAAELTAPVDNFEMLTKTAGYGFTSADSIAQAWEDRKIILRHKNPAFAQKAAEVAATLRESPLDVRDTDTRIKLATVMDSFDRFTGIDHLYGGTLELPEETIFEITQKTAAEVRATHFSTVTGNTYASEDLQKLSSADLEKWLGAELANEVSDVLTGNVDQEKLAELAPTLPRTEAKTFESMLSSLGLRPVLKEKRAYSARTDEDWNRLAQ